MNGDIMTQKILEENRVLKLNYEKACNEVRRLEQVLSGFERTGHSQELVRRNEELADRVEKLEEKLRELQEENDLLRSLTWEKQIHSKILSASQEHFTDYSSNGCADSISSRLNTLDLPRISVSDSESSPQGIGAVYIIGKTLGK